MKTPKTTSRPAPTRKAPAKASAAPGPKLAKAMRDGKAAPAAPAPAAGVTTTADAPAAPETPATLAPTAATQPATSKPPRAAGVIATLIALLRAGGGTKAELYQGLLAKFPARGEGMKTTVAVQLAGLPRSGKLVIHQERNAEGVSRYWADPVPAEQVPPVA